MILLFTTTAGMIWASASYRAASAMLFTTVMPGTLARYRVTRYVPHIQRFTCSRAGRKSQDQ